MARLAPLLMVVWLHTPPVVLVSLGEGGGGAFLASSWWCCQAILVTAGLSLRRPPGWVLVGAGIATASASSLGTIGVAYLLILAVSLWVHASEVRRLGREELAGGCLAVVPRWSGCIIPLLLVSVLTGTWVALLPGLAFFMWCEAMTKWIALGFLLGRQPSTAPVEEAQPVAGPDPDEAWTAE